MQPLFDTCAELFKAHRYTECIRRLSGLVRTAQTADELLVAAGVAYVALFRGLEMRLLRRAARLAPRDPKVVLYQCATYLERGRFLEAEELLTPWLEADSWTAEELARARAYLAVSYAGRRRFRTAGRALERAAAMAAIAGADAQRLVEYVRLSILIYEGRWEEGIQGLNTYIAAHPDEHRAYILLATCCEHLGEADAVLRTLRAACDRFPEHPELHIRLSTAAWAAGQTVLAQDALDRAGALLTGRRAERIVRHMRAMLHEPGRRLPVPPIRQGHDLCFPACLAMLLAYYGQPADQRAIGAAVMEENGGTSLFRVLRYLEERGWVVRTFRATPKRVRQLVDLGVPPILGVEWAGGRTSTSASATTTSGSTSRIPAPSSGATCGWRASTTSTPTPATGRWPSFPRNRPACWTCCRRRKTPPSAGCRPAGNTSPRTGSPRPGRCLPRSSRATGPSPPPSSACGSGRAWGPGRARWRPQTGCWRSSPTTGRSGWRSHTT